MPACFGLPALDLFALLDFPAGRQSGRLPWQAGTFGLSQGMASALLGAVHYEVFEAGHLTRWGSLLLLPGWSPSRLRQIVTPHPLAILSLSPLLASVPGPPSTSALRFPPGSLQGMEGMEP